jgi:hypothetical protein
MSIRFIIIFLFIPNFIFSEVPEIRNLPEYFSSDTGYKLKNRDSTCLNKIFIQPSYEFMRSSHGNNFTGLSIDVSYNFSKTVYLGLGTEFSYSPLHIDNGWRLSNLKFLPFFLDFKLNLIEYKRVCPFINLSGGISFINYKKEDYYNPGMPYNVSEKGLYVFAGTGCYIRINKKINSIIVLGFKGFHMSFNNLDVNPHGLTLRIGLII